MLLIIQFKLWHSLGKSVTSANMYFFYFFLSFLLSDPELTHIWGNNDTYDAHQNVRMHNGKTLVTSPSEIRSKVNLSVDRERIDMCYFILYRN